MERFGLGDIVYVKLFGEKHYYIVTDILDLTKDGDDEPNVECEIMLIYPVLAKPRPERINQKELAITAKFKSKDYNILMEYVEKERERAGLFFEPEYLRIVGDDGGKKYTSPPKKKESAPKFGNSEIRKILNNNLTEIRTEEFVGRMNTHLELLHKAISENNEKDIAFQKEQLEKVRQTLMELEYFQMEERRAGVSIRVK